MVGSCGVRNVFNALLLLEVSACFDSPWMVSLNSKPEKMYSPEYRIPRIDTCVEKRGYIGIPIKAYCRRRQTIHSTAESLRKHPTRPAIDILAICIPIALNTINAASNRLESWHQLN
jgi:hypothetical protein